MDCLILAGGLGTRMRPHTEYVPKAMLPVAGRPFADWQLQWLAFQSARRIVYSIGHLGTMIEDFVGDGARWGVNVEYVREEGELLGTAGAIRRAVDCKGLGDAFFVLYGDSYLQVEMPAVEIAFGEVESPVLMTILENNGRWETSNAVVRDRKVVLYDKHPASRPAEMKYVDYGLFVMSRQIVEDRIIPGATADLAPLLKALSLERQVEAFEVTERFFEVGSPEGLRDLEQFLTAGTSSPSVVGEARISARHKQ